MKRRGLERVARRGLERVARRGLEPGPTGWTGGVATFLRGLSVGLLVGAAIAGSRIWRRFGGRPRG